MIFLWTTSKRLSSKVITWGLEEDCSHFAMVFDEKPEGYGIVLHSELQGVHFSWWNDFRATHEIRHALRPKNFSIWHEETFYQAVVKKFYGHPYDKRAFCYWVYRAVLKKFLGEPIPSMNNWGCPSSFLCTALAEALQEPSSSLLLVSLEGLKDLEMVSPHTLYERMRQSRMLEEVEDCKKFGPPSSEVSRVSSSAG